MSVEIKVPTLGESVTEATIGQWFKKVGDTVAADEPLVELETDKVTVEVPAPSAGVLEAIAAKEGDTVNVGALIGAIANGAAGVATPKAAPAAQPAAPAQTSPAALAGEETPSLKLNGEPGGVPAASGNGSVPPSPSAQKLMAENGIANGSIEGSGKHGQVLKEDVLATPDAGRLGDARVADRPRRWRRPLPPAYADLDARPHRHGADADGRARGGAARAVADQCRRQRRGNFARARPGQRARPGTHPAALDAGASARR